MFGLILSVLILGFGIFLKVTKNPGFTSSKKYAWMFIALGIITLIGRLFIMYQQGDLQL